MYDKYKGEIKNEKLKIADEWHVTVTAYDLDTFNALCKHIQAFREKNK